MRLCPLRSPWLEDVRRQFDAIRFGVQSFRAQLDLSSAKLGAVFVSNADERIAELTEDIPAIADIVEASVLSRKDGERLCGRLQFANAQLFGRSVGDLGKHITSGRKVLETGLENRSGALAANQARK